jgi:hypothetical protein
LDGERQLSGETEHIFQGCLKGAGQPPVHVEARATLAGENVRDGRGRNAHLAGGLSDRPASLPDLLL